MQIKLNPFEWFCTWPRFEEKAKSNLEMGCWSNEVNFLFKRNTVLCYKQCSLKNPVIYCVNDLLGFCQAFVRQSGFLYHLSVVKPNPRKLLWPITRDAENPIIQSFKQIHVASAKRASTSLLIGWESIARYKFSQSQSVAMQNQSNHEITFDAQLKTHVAFTLFRKRSPVK